MKVKVRFFAMCREAAQTDDADLELSEGADLEQFWTAVARRFPALEKYRSISRVAINLKYASAKERLMDGDEVCIIPPVSGG